jgi:hypothetical protein
MGDTMVAPPGPEEQPADSFLSRALGVFISPGATFEAIVRRPGFIVPLIVVTLAAYAMIESILQKIGAEQIVRRSIEMSPRASSMTPDQITQAAHQASTFTAIAMRAGGILGPGIYLLIVAAAGLFIVNAIFGGTMNFKVSLSVMCYANLVGLIGGVLGIVMVLFGDPDQFNVQNPVPTNVGFFLNMRDTPKFLYTIASSFDIFTTWMLILAALGLSAATARKVRPTPIFLTYLGMWVIWVLIKGGLGMLTG